MKAIFQSAHQRIRNSYRINRALAARVRRRLSRDRIIDRSKIVLVAPALLSFENNRDETIVFFEKLQNGIDKVAGRQIAFHINFEKLIDIGLVASVYLVSEFDRWQRLRGNAPLTAGNILNTPNRVLERLFGLGFFRVLGTRIKKSVRNKFSVTNKYIPFITNTEIDTEEQSKFIELLCEYGGSSDQVERDVYRSIVEAVANAVEHAYIYGDLKIGRRWWLAGTIDIESKRKRIILLDHGVGIPAALPKTSKGQKILENLREIVGLKTDSELIMAAASYGRSRLQDEERGKGLPDVLSLADTNPLNEVIIRSGCGAFAHRLSGDTNLDFAKPIRGTIVEWKLFSN